MSLQIRAVQCRLIRVRATERAAAATVESIGIRQWYFSSHPLRRRLMPARVKEVHGLYFMDMMSIGACLPVLVVGEDGAVASSATGVRLFSWIMHV
jgi:hypothetical protein